MALVYVNLPLTDDVVSGLKSGDQLYLSGTLYTARDAAHKRMTEEIEADEALPVDLTGQMIYYVGPTPAKPEAVIGSAGPTTSSRMDSYTPTLLKKGLKGMIGKGYRSDAVVEAIVENNAVYCAAIGGTGALLSKTIVSSEVVAYDDLGTEAIHKLQVENFPCIVINDSYGNDWYKDSQKAFREK